MDLRNSIRLTKTGPTKVFGQTFDMLCLLLEKDKPVNEILRDCSALGLKGPSC